MLSLLLLALSSPAAPDHAALHPAEAEFYLACPDIQRLEGAYAQAPVIRMLGDELGLPAEALELRPMIEGMLAEALGSPEDAQLVLGARAFSMSVDLPAAEDAPPGVQVVIDYASAEHAQRLSSLLSERLPKPAPAAGGPVTSAPAPRSAELGGMPFGWTVEDQRVVLWGGAHTEEAWRALRESSSGTLGAGEPWRRGGSAFAEGSAPTLLEGYYHLDPAQVAPLLGDLPIDLPADEVSGHARMRMQLRGDRFVSEMFCSNDGGEERAIIGARPVEAKWLDGVPADTLFTYSTSLDGAAAADLLMERFGPMFGSQHEEDEGADDLRSHLRGLLSRVGPGAVVFMGRLGLGIPPTTMRAQVAQPETFQSDLAAAIDRLPGLSTKTKDTRVKRADGERVKVPVTEVVLPTDLMPQGVPVPIGNPAFAVHDGMLLMSSSRSALRKELTRLLGGADEGTNVLSASGFELPEDASSTFVMDWGGLIEGVVGLVRGLGGMLGGMGEGGEMPFDFSKIPPAETFTRFFRPTFHYTRPVEGGTYHYHEASFGPETWLGIAAAAVKGIETAESGGGLGF